MDTGMHTLTFHSHTAVLDPRTGMGLLVLPVPAGSVSLLALRCHGESADTMAQRWFDSADNHRTVLGQLHTLGWQLPRNNDGAHAWYDAGCTQCCGRTMISLTSVDVEDEAIPVAWLIDSTRRMEASATTACDSTGHHLTRTTST
jgi:hypothetical protein